MQNDQNRLLELYNNNNDSLSTAAEDLLLANFDYRSMSFEQLQQMAARLREQSPLRKYLESLIHEKQAAIVLDLQGLTAEEIVEYGKRNPGKRTIIDDYLNAIVPKNLKAMNMHELAYLNRELDLVAADRIKREQENRKAELAAELRLHVAEFCDTEAKQLRHLFYALEKTTLDFLHDGFRRLASYYAQIVMIPDDARQAENQFRQLKELCIPDDSLQTKLQQVADRFCGQVNDMRAEFAKRAMRDSFPRLSLVVTQPSLQYTVKDNSLASVNRLRQTYAKLQLSSAGSTASDTLASRLAIVSVAQKEAQARSNYMTEMLRTLEEQAVAHHALLKENIQNEVKRSENAYIESISGQKADTLSALVPTAPDAVARPETK